MWRSNKNETRLKNSDDDGDSDGGCGDDDDDNDNERCKIGACHHQRVTKHQIRCSAHCFFEKKRNSTEFKWMKKITFKREEITALLSTPRICIYSNDVVSSQFVCGIVQVFFCFLSLDSVINISVGFNKCG